MAAQKVLFRSAVSLKLIRRGLAAHHPVFPDG